MGAVLKPMGETSEEVSLLANSHLGPLESRVPIVIHARRISATVHAWAKHPLGAKAGYSTALAPLGERVDRYRRFHQPERDG